MPLALIFMHLSTADIAASSKCETNSYAQYDQKAALPSGALTAFGAPIAEKGQPFQSTDVVITPALPMYRFVKAEQRGCQLIVTYEYGGRGSGIDRTLLLADGTEWRRISRLIYDRR